LRTKVNGHTKTKNTKALLLTSKQTKETTFNMTILFDFDLYIDLVEMPIHLNPAEEVDLDDEERSTAISLDGCSLSDCSSVLMDDDLDEELPPLVLSRERSMSRERLSQYELTLLAAALRSNTTSTRDTIDGDSNGLSRTNGAARRDSLVLARGRIGAAALLLSDPPMEDESDDDWDDALSTYMIPLSMEDEDDEDDDDEEFMIPLSGGYYEENKGPQQGNATLRRRPSLRGCV
jgi:hypothetical protein